MAATSDPRIEIVRTLVESAPDRIVDDLQQALAEAGGDTVLASVRRLVQVEAEDRALRNAVFQPVVPLFAGDGSDTRSLVFPTRALASLWRGLKASAPDDVAAAAKVSAGIAIAIVKEQRPPDASRCFDTLVTAAADGLRAGDLREFRTAAEQCDAARPGAAGDLAACMDISHIVRRTLARLPDWVARPNEEAGAAARLAYKDAVAVSDDAGPRFFEMLAAQLTPPWMLLRIISAVMDKPTERYLHDSELGAFPERVMADIDEALVAIAHLDLDAGPEAGRVAGRRVEVVTQQTFELEVAMELTRDAGWGRRIFEQKRSLANVVEARLRESAKLIAAALPMETAGFGRRRRSYPKLDVLPDPRTAARAMTGLTFAHEIRFSANYGGFSAAHAKATDGLWSAIEGYADDVMDHLRTGDVADVAIARTYLKIAADAAMLIHDEKDAELLRRRAASACAPPDAIVTIDA